MYEDFTQERIAQLRMQKGSSARDMSLSLGQNVSYINKIENKKSAAVYARLFLYLRIFRSNSPGVL